MGDRIKKPDQLNGKSANLNHVLLRKIYPNVRKAEEVPRKDIFMVMDCDHMVRSLQMHSIALRERVVLDFLLYKVGVLDGSVRVQVKPDIFNKMGPTLLDPKMAVCLAPQCFHNIIYPDALDAANGDFMFGKLPFYFGAGVLFVTGVAP